MPCANRLCAELRDRVARVDALRAALVAEVAPRAVPDAVLFAVALEPLDRRAVARVADEAHALRERLRAEELGIGLHRVALRDAAAAVDAERLFVDHVHPLLRDPVLATVVRPLVAGLQPRLDRLELGPEGIHVDDEVLDDREIPHRRDRRGRDPPARCRTCASCRRGRRRRPFASRTSRRSSSGSSCGTRASRRGGP